MNLNYKQLGQFIEPINIRNKDLAVDKLLGVSIQKCFMPSIANTVGTDMSKYKVVRKLQFAYGPVTSRNGDKISVALLEDCDVAIVSQAYIVFQIIDHEELDPEYLMMWFRRPEFDRYARFMSHGSARETFDWDEMCETELPVPSIEEQREIVKEYNTIVNRINLNEQLNQKLEETAQALYKHWFVDFEFPNENGQPFKSSGGEMVYNEELDQEIPEGWTDGVLEDVLLFKNGKKRPNKSGDFPSYGGNGIIDYVDEFNNEDVIAMGRVGAYCGSLYRIISKCWISDNAICAESRNETYMYCFYLLKYLNLNSRSEGTGQPLLTQGILNQIKVVKPKIELTKKFDRLTDTIFRNGNSVKKQNELLNNTRDILLSRLSQTKLNSKEQLV